MNKADVLKQAQVWHAVVRGFVDDIQQMDDAELVALVRAEDKHCVGLIARLTQPQQTQGTFDSLLSSEHNEIDRLVQHVRENVRATRQ